MNKKFILAILPLMSLISFSQTDIVSVGADTLFITSATEFTVKDYDVVANGDITGDGDFAMRSTAAAQELNMNGNSVDNLVVANTNDVNLTGEATIGNDLEFVAGNVDIAGNDLTITDGGTFTNASSSNKVVTSGSGNVIQTVGTTALTFPIAFAGTDYNPAEITAAGTGNEVSLRVTDDVFWEGNTGSQINNNLVDVRWNLNNEGADPLDVTFQWVDSQELPEYDRTISTVGYHDDANPGNYLETPSSAVSGSSPYTITGNGITTDGVYVVGDNSKGPLPIELLYFDAQLVDQSKVQLDWETASETNNDFFTIEKSKDGENWDFVTEVDGAGTSTEVLTYQTFDLRPYAGVSYYRLKQTDFDGEFSYSDIRSVEIQTSGISVRPNPTESMVTVSGSGTELSNMSLTNSYGKYVQSINNGELDEKAAEVKVDLSNLAPGVYYLRTATHTEKIVKQ